MQRQVNGPHHITPSADNMTTVKVISEDSQNEVLKKELCY